MKKILFIIFVCTLIFPLYALDIPAEPANYVNDYAGILSAREESSLNRTLGKIERTSSNQIVIAIFNSLDGENLEDYSIRLAEKWKIGQKGKDNGVILSFFMKERKMRIEVGYGLEHVLTDAYSRMIIDRYLTPSFKQKDYAQGLAGAVAAINDIIRGTYKADPSKYRYVRPKQKTSFIGMVFKFIIGLVVLFLVIRNPWLLLLFFNSRGFSSRGVSRGGFSGFSGFSGGGGSFGGGGSSGGW